MVALWSAFQHFVSGSQARMLRHHSNLLTSHLQKSLLNQRQQRARATRKTDYNNIQLILHTIQSLLPYKVTLKQRNRFFNAEKTPKCDAALTFSMKDSEEPAETFRCLPSLPAGLNRKHLLVLSGSCPRSAALPRNPQSKYYADNFSFHWLC